jgi:hypothetical protein
MLASGIISAKKQSSMQINDQLVGYIGDRKMLDFRIK